MLPKNAPGGISSKFASNKRKQWEAPPTGHSTCCLQSRRGSGRPKCLPHVAIKNKAMPICWCQQSYLSAIMESCSLQMASSAIKMWAQFAGGRGVLHFCWLLIMAGRKIMADLHVSNSSVRTGIKYCQGHSIELIQIVGRNPECMPRASYSLFSKYRHSFWKNNTFCFLFVGKETLMRWVVQTSFNLCVMSRSKKKTEETTQSRSAVPKNPKLFMWIIFKKGV